MIFTFEERAQTLLAQIGNLKNTRVPLQDIINKYSANPNLSQTLSVVFESFL